MWQKLWYSNIKDIIILEGHYPQIIWISELNHIWSKWSNRIAWFVTYFCYNKRKLKLQHLYKSFLSLLLVIHVVTWPVIIKLQCVSYFSWSLNQLLGFTEQCQLNIQWFRGINHIQHLTLMILCKSDGFNHPLAANKVSNHCVLSCLGSYRPLLKFTYFRSFSKIV